MKFWNSEQEPERSGIMVVPRRFDFRVVPLKSETLSRVSKPGGIEVRPSSHPIKNQKFSSPVSSPGSKPGVFHWSPPWEILRSICPRGIGFVCASFVRYIARRNKWNMNRRECVCVAYCQSAEPTTTATTKKGGKRPGRGACVYLLWIAASYCTHII